ncbi:hypothetical protein RUM44_007156 [Polyplax serrata]|uniref:Uncharacterized protein n=1 Tax=Polyplax serrata TaxID=468196 RepID=A0ABR1AZX2_POLSC
MYRTLVAHSEASATSRTTATTETTREVDVRLIEIRSALVDMIKRYQKLEKHFMVSRMGPRSPIEINKFAIAVEVIENKLKLCDLDLNVLEVERTKDTDTEMRKRIRYLEERLQETTEELVRQKEVQHKLRLSYKESKQKRMERMKVLLKELKQYLSHVVLINNDDVIRSAEI